MRCNVHEGMTYNIPKNPTFLKNQQVATHSIHGVLFQVGGCLIAEYVLDNARQPVDTIHVVCVLIHD
jgi:hypothetical protein